MKWYTVTARNNTLVYNSCTYWTTFVVTTDYEHIQYLILVLIEGSRKTIISLLKYIAPIGLCNIFAFYVKHHETYISISRPWSLRYADVSFSKRLYEAKGILFYVLLTYLVCFESLCFRSGRTLMIETVFFKSLYFLIFLFMERFLFSYTTICWIFQ